MLFYIDEILNVIDKYNANREIEQHIDLAFVIEEIEDIENDQDIQRVIKELEARVQ